MRWNIKTPLPLHLFSFVYKIKIRTTCPDKTDRKSTPDDNRKTPLPSRNYYTPFFLICQYNLIKKRAAFSKNAALIFRLYTAGSVVGEHSGRGILYVAALPRLVGHPKSDDHFRLLGVILFKYLTIQKRFLGKGCCVCVLFAPFLKFRIGVLTLGIFL